MRARQSDTERTLLQESGPFDPRVAIPADVVLVHGLRWNLAEKLAGWRVAGYPTYAMTAIAWGSLGPYLRGEWDGQNHYGDVQMTASGHLLDHGQHDTYYMTPTHKYTAYLTELAKTAIDSGAASFVLEEPEFWVDGAYSPAFHAEWVAHYAEAWQDPRSSPTASYRAAQLQHYLFSRAITAICRDVKEYARQKGLPEFRCYVATHSVLNYAQWRIVSPASHLAHIADCDGIIGQVWTGTIRQPNLYQGRRRSRPFETALCEYAAIEAVVRGTDKRLWFLADPIADDPRSNWAHYRRHWHDTLSAALLFPEVVRFEVMPWPRRVFLPPHARRPPWARLPQGEARPPMPDLAATLFAPHIPLAPRWCLGWRWVARWRFAAVLAIQRQFRFQHFYPRHKADNVRFQCHDFGPQLGVVFFDCHTSTLPVVALSRKPCCFLVRLNSYNWRTKRQPFYTYLYLSCYFA